MLAKSLRVNIKERMQECAKKSPMVAEMGSTATVAWYYIKQPRNNSNAAIRIVVVFWPCKKLCFILGRRIFLKPPKLNKALKSARR